MVCSFFLSALLLWHLIQRIKGWSQKIQWMMLPKWKCHCPILVSLFLCPCPPFYHRQMTKSGQHVKKQQHIQNITSACLFAFSYLRKKVFFYRSSNCDKIWHFSPCIWNKKVIKEYHNGKQLHSTIFQYHLSVALSRTLFLPPGGKCRRPF